MAVDVDDLPAWAVVSAKRREHVQRVVALLDSWADQMGASPTERERWRRAGFLHDALRDADPARLAELAGVGWPAPRMRHGPAAAALASEHGEVDLGVLNAVRYHTLGFADWDAVGRMLYLADYLEPGRPQAPRAHAKLASQVPREPEGVLREVAADRIGWTVRSGWPLHPETVRFWNSIAT